MSLYKFAGLFFILISFSFDAISSYLNPPPLPACKDIYRPSPVYPSRAIALRIDGVVRFSYDINSFGRVENVHILNAQPANMFEESLKESLTMWRYDCYGVPQIGLISTVVFRMAGSS
ncbi:TPA: TonB family protein [Salmonella enterica subsp. diarizonae serovar 61:i:z]